MRALTTTTAIAAGLLLLAGCTSEPANETVSADDALENILAEMPAEGGPMNATAALRSADGTDMGTATATEVDGAVQVIVNARGLTPGPHGLHVHMVGACDAPTFETAGGHWNPTGRQHGSENPQGQHAGDMPNIDAAADGTGSTTFTLASGNFAGLLDADGSSLVIHEGPDDYVTDPAGNSGGRIACGIFTAA